MEQIYVNSAGPELFELITKGCIGKAEIMGLPLVVKQSSDPRSLPYKGKLSALGGPAPFEYVDALSEIKKNGLFTIPKTSILYMPKN